MTANRTLRKAPPRTVPPQDPPNLPKPCFPAESELVAKIMPFYKGDKGDTGDKASISADTPNAIEAGSDGKMLVRLKREIQIPSWPPAFALPNVTYVVRDPETGLVSKWETNDEGQPAAITNPEGVVKVITQIFVNSAGEQLAHL